MTLIEHAVSIRNGYEEKRTLEPGIDTNSNQNYCSAFLKVPVIVDAENNGLIF